LNRDYKLSFEKRPIPLGVLKRPKRTRPLQIGEKKNCNSRTQFTNSVEEDFQFLLIFLFTSDVISPDDSPPPSTNPLAPIPRSHPPPLCYLPAVLTPAQEAFILRRKAEVIEAAEQEWNLFHEERTAGIDEISRTRQRVAEEDAARRNDLNMNKDEMETDVPSQNDDAPTSAVAEDTGRSIVPDSDSVIKVTEMDVDDAAGQTRANESGKEELTSLPADDEDAVEY